MNTPYWLRSIRERRLRRRLPGAAEDVEDALADAEGDLRLLEEAEQLLLQARHRIDAVARGGSYARHAVVILNSVSIKLNRLERRLSNAQSEIFHERRLLVERSEARRP